MIQSFFVFFQQINRSVKFYIENLILSISSSNFYRKVYLHYKSYGIKYVFNLCFISSLIYPIYSLMFFNGLNQYLKTGNVNSYTININYVLNHLPSMEYDGKILRINEKVPYYIKNLLVIDTSNNFHYEKYPSLPFIISKDKLIIQLLGKSSIITVEFSKIFGTQSLKIDKKTICEYFEQYIVNKEQLIVYAFTPIVISIRFITILLYQAIIILITHFLCYILKAKTSLKQITRVILYSSGVSIILEPIFLFIHIPFLSFIVRFFPIMLLIKGVIVSQKTK